MREDLIQKAIDNLNKSGAEYVHKVDILNILNNLLQPELSLPETLLKNVIDSGLVPFNIPAQHNALLYLLRDKIAEEQSKPKNKFLELSKAEAIRLKGELYNSVSKYARCDWGAQSIALDDKLTKFINS